MLLQKITWINSKEKFRENNSSRRTWEDFEEVRNFPTTNNHAQVNFHNHPADYKPRAFSSSCHNSTFTFTVSPGKLVSVDAALWSSFRIWTQDDADIKFFITVFCHGGKIYCCHGKHWVESRKQRSKREMSCFLSRLHQKCFEYFREYVLERNFDDVFLSENSTSF